MDVGVFFKSPVSYLLCTGYFILSSVLIVFMLCSRDTSLRCIKVYCTTDRPCGTPYLILVLSLVVVYCLNVLLLNAYLYHQRWNTIEVSFTNFVEVTTSNLTEHFWLTLVCLPCHMAWAFYVCGLFASYIFDLICRFKLDQIQGSLVVCALITWFLSGIALMVCYALLPDRKMTLQEVGLVTFPMLCFEVLFIVLAYSKKLPLTRCPQWLLNLAFSTVMITLVATILVQPVVSDPTGHSQHSAQQPTQEDGQCVEMDDAGIQPGQLYSLQYSDRNGKTHELRIKDRLYTYCKDVADIFGYEIVVNICAADLKNCCQRVFSAWRDQGAPGYPLTWKGLVKVLMKLGLKRLAAEIKAAVQHNSVC